MPKNWNNGNRSAIGEPFVWLTAAGMIVGIVMVFVLLYVIFVNGLAAFWPRQVVQVEVRTDAAAQVWLGEVTHQQERHPSTVGPGMSAIDTQLFVGNRDAHGFSFKYFNDSELGDYEYPENVLKIERMEYGFALGFPIDLTLPDGTLIPGDSPEFPEALAREEHRVNELRDDIHAIEKVAIGKINRKLKSHREDVAGIARKLGDEQAAEATPEVQAIREKMAVLQQSYEELDTERLKLREGLSTATLRYSIAQGDDRSTTTGNVVSHYFPNRLSTIGRLGRFAHNFWVFLSEDPREANTEGGIFPAIFGTFVMTVLMSLLVTPFGVLAAIYLQEYAKQGPFLTGVRIAVNNLAGVPSIVFGVFGLGFFVYVLGGQIDHLFFPNSEGPVFGTGGILWASFTLALLTVPVVIVASEEALASVPRGAREASLACGASKWQTIQRIVLPASAPGILTGVMLAMARGAGEVAPLMLVGVVKIAETLPVNSVYPYLHAEQKFMHLGFHIIYDLGFQSPDSEAARPMVFATTFLLIVLVILMNLTGIIIRERLRRRYKSSTF